MLRSRVRVRVRAGGDLGEVPAEGPVGARKVVYVLELVDLRVVGSGQWAVGSGRAVGRGQ